jgi:hypothetical protein
MKKRDFWTGLIMMALGLLCLAGTIFWNTVLGSILYGFSGALIGPGAVLVWKYIRWTKLETADACRRHFEEEQIELRDERKEMLRNRSGRYAYVVGMLAAVVSMNVFFLLGKLGMLEEAASRLIVLFLGGYAFFQVLAGWVIYQLLDRKY